MSERLNEKGIPVHRQEKGKLAGFIGYMPQVPSVGESISIGRSIYRVKAVDWVFDEMPREWEARLELKQYGEWK